MRKQILLLLLPIAILFCMGLVMIFDTSSAEVLDWHLEKHTWHDLIKQLLYAALGVGFAWSCNRWGYQKVLFYSPQLLLLSSLLLLCTFLPIIGREVNGSHRWISLGPLSIQPSEFVKYIICAYFIHKLQQKEGVFESFTDFLKTTSLVALPIFLILVEPNNGTVAVIVITLITIAFVAAVPYRYWGIPLVLALCVGGVVIATVPYVQGRIVAYLHPERDIRGKGHQPYQAKIAAGSGKVWGKGPGRSIQKLSYLPEAQNDYIAAIFAEEYGFVGMALLIGMYMLFAMVGATIAFQCVSLPAFLMSVSILFLITFQAFLNLGVVSGLLPSTGLNLPFFSQGGTSLIANSGALGLFISILQKQESAIWEK